MTDRLDRIENILTGLAEKLDRTEAISNSNARAIEATNNALDAKFNQIADAVIRSQDRLERLERWLGEPFTDDPDIEDEEP